MKKVNDLEKITGMSRRVIQEYEKAGIAEKPANKNKYGHLLYGDQEIERLFQLRFYRELGYDKNKVKAVMQETVQDRQKEMERTAKELMETKKKLDNLIPIVQIMQEFGCSFVSLSSAFLMEDCFGSFGFDDTFNILGAYARIIQSLCEEECICIDIQDVITEEDMDAEIELFDQIMKLCENGKDACSEEVQNVVASMHKIFSKAFSESVLIFSQSAIWFSIDNEAAADIDADYGQGRAAYFCDALQYYCNRNADNDVDREYEDAINNIEKLGRAKYRTDSEEVQAEVKKIHHFWSKVNLYTEKGKLEIIRILGEVCGSQVFVDAFDDGAERGACWFISRAIQIYCDRLQAG